MGTNFFTNEKENTLLEKIEGVFKYRKIYFFDALVGYFRASGYIKEKMNIIDNIVYHLYDLTYDEVLIVDPKTPITRDEYEKN